MTGKRYREVQKRPLLSPDQLADAVEQLAVIAKAEGERIGLVGGYAMQAYGSDRLTYDVDIIARHRLVTLSFGTPLTFGGESTVAPNGVPVDVIVRDDDYAELYDEALSMATKFTDMPIPVVASEYLAAMKMAAGRTKDQADIESLLVLGTVDVKKARKIIRKHLGVYAAGEWDRIVEEVEWKRKTGRL